MTVVLPDGARLGNVRLADGRANGHHAEWHEVAPGRYNIVCWSHNGEALREGPTALLHFDINGGGEVKVCDVLLANASYEGLAPQEATGVASVKVDDGDSPAYSINGIRATGNTRGIVIRNGKKQVRK